MNDDRKFVTGKKLLKRVKLSDETLESILIDARKAQDERGLYILVPTDEIVDGLKRAGFSFNPLPSPFGGVCGNGQ